MWEISEENLLIEIFPDGLHSSRAFPVHQVCRVSVAGFFFCQVLSLEKEISINYLTCDLDAATVSPCSSPQSNLLFFCIGIVWIFSYTFGSPCCPSLPFFPDPGDVVSIPSAPASVAVCGPTNRGFRVFTIAPLVTLLC